MSIYRLCRTHSTLSFFLSYAWRERLISYRCQLNTPAIIPELNKHSAMRRTSDRELSRIEGVKGTVHTYNSNVFTSLFACACVRLRTCVCLFKLVFMSMDDHVVTHMLVYIKLQE